MRNTGYDRKCYKLGDLAMAIVESITPASKVSEIINGLYTPMLGWFYELPDGKIVQITKISSYGSVTYRTATNTIVMLPNIVARVRLKARRDLKDFPYQMPLTCIPGVSKAVRAKIAEIEELKLSQPTVAIQYRKYPKCAWVAAVMADNTLLGYEEWVASHKKYMVLIDTECVGWVAYWRENEKSLLFDSRAAASKAIASFVRRMFIVNIVNDTGCLLTKGDCKIEVTYK